MGNGGQSGVGKGIATALGCAGWTVYVTARSVAGAPSGHLPETIEMTADAVTCAGGHGIAVAMIGKPVAAGVNAVRGVEVWLRGDRAVEGGVG